MVVHSHVYPYKLIAYTGASKKGGKEGINYAFNCRIESDSFANCITIFLTAACGFYFYHGHCYYRDRNFLCEIRQILLCIFSGYL